MLSYKQKSSKVWSGEVWEHLLEGKDLKTYSEEHTFGRFGIASTFGSYA